MPAPEELIETLDLNPPMLYINDEERRFMLLLAPILTRSPAPSNALLMYTG